MFMNTKTFQDLTIRGRIAVNIDFKFLGNGTAVANFAVIVNRGSKTDFIPVVAWGEKAKKINDHATKGDLIAFDGELRSDTSESEEHGKRIELKVQVKNDSEHNEALLDIYPKSNSNTGGTNGKTEV